MKNTFKYMGLLSLYLLVIISCRKEVVINKTDSSNQGFVKSSKVSSLIKQTAMHDGSFDNIIDHANNFSIKMPYTVIVNGQQVTINSKNDLETVEDILDASDTDTDTIQIVFPVTIILPDYSEVVIHNQNELDSYIAQSTGENEMDDDIECVDFVYPITTVIYNTVTERTQTITVNNDKELEDLFDDLDDHDLVSFNFPIQLKLYDDSVVTVSNISELESVIENNKDACDEDDDNDYNDDDCDDCTTSQIVNVLTSCHNWTIDELERNDTDLGDNYTGYSLEFSSNGSLSVTENGNVHMGTWNATGVGSDINLVIAVPSIPDFNANWHLEEIKQDGTEKKVKLEVDDDNKMKLVSTCP